MKRVRLDELGAFVQEVLTQFPAKKSHAMVVALSGALGAGKTTFVQAFAKALGVIQTVQSPTYVLMKRYDIANQAILPFKTLVHIDAYRLEDPAEFATLKPEEFLSDPNTIVVVEWPERVEGMLPKPDLTLTFSSQDAGEGERYIEHTNG